MFKAYTLICAIGSVLSIVAGLALLIASSVLIGSTNFLQSVWKEIFSLSIYSVIIGALAVIFATGLLYVVNRKFPALTALFSTLMFVVVILSVVCVIILGVGFSGVRNDAFVNTDMLVHNYTQSNQNGSVEQVLNSLQQSLQCCGFTGALDWSKLLPGQESTPDSCCVSMVAGCGKDALMAQNKIYLRGCAQPVYSFLRQKYIVLLVLNCILLAFMIIATVFGYISERFIRQEYESM
jgi:hypothetical protein